MDGGYDVLAERPECGFDWTEDAAESGIIIRWKRRVKRNDIDYALFISEDIQGWEANPSDVEEIGTEPDPDGVMETVRTRVDRPHSPRIFLSVKARRK